MKFCHAPPSCSQLRGDTTKKQSGAYLRTGVRVHVVRLQLAGIHLGDSIHKL